jgi:hypothetical protein
VQGGAAERLLSSPEYGRFPALSTRSVEAQLD